MHHGFMKTVKLSGKHEVWSTFDQTLRKRYAKYMKVVSIYEAKTQFSKLVKRAAAGETIYVGAYGKPTAIIGPLPKRKSINFGLGIKEKDSSFDYENLVESDPEIVAMFDESINRETEE